MAIKVKLYYRIPHTVMQIIHSEGVELLKEIINGKLKNGKIMEERINVECLMLNFELLEDEK